MATRSIVTHQPDVACDVCGRRLLRGEQPDVFIGAGRRRTVCELCIPRATGEGWMREADVQSASLGAGRGRGGRSLLERLRPRRELDAPEQPPARKRMRRLLHPREDEYGAAFLDQALGGAEFDQELDEDFRAQEAEIEAAPSLRIDVSRRARPSVPQAVRGESETQELTYAPQGGRSAEDDDAGEHARADRVEGGELEEGYGQPSSAFDEPSQEQTDPDQPQQAPPGSERDHSAASQLLLEEALDAFNTSDYVRRVAGIARSLGSPLVRVKHAGDRRVEVLLAWELCWYRYEIDLDQPTAAPTLIADGMELDELRDEDMAANAVAEERGRLMLAG